MKVSRWGKNWSSFPHIHHVLLLLVSLRSSILQRWKRALHVPLRLDVYYQHPDQKRELLERWCLEYAPSHFQQQQNLDFYSSDPIVQLRHVCKKIVIWLRTLYCWSRMLPSQALRGTTGNGGQNSPIGFSIYVVSEGNDDVTTLVSNQQFLAQGQPSSVLTPYGELGWKVFYAPKTVVDRLVPQPSPYHRHAANRSESRPIPTNNNSHGHPQQQHQGPFELQRHNSSPVMQPTSVQSAPHSRQMMYHRSNSAAATMRVSPELHKSPTPFRSNSTGRGIIMSAAAAAASVAQHLSPQPQRQTLLRPPNSDAHATTSAQGAANGGGSDGPPRALSGLSLAMMMSDENIDEADETADDNDNSDPASGATNDQAEKRRAALHHAPPNYSSNTGDALAASPVLKKSSLATAGDYGYAYNSHIPLVRNAGNNNRVSPIDQNGALVDRTASPSPSLQAGTPPTGAGFLMGATPPKAGGFLGGAGIGGVTTSTLIPPRSAVTPPFVRPAGFLTPTEQLPNQQLPPPADGGSASVPYASASGNSLHTNNTTAAAGNNALPTTPAGIGGNASGAGSGHPVTSLDLLHSSPFQQPPNGSLLSSLSVPQDPHNYMNSVLSGDFRLQAAAEAAYGSTTAADNPFYSASHHHYYPPSSLDLQDEMPFAVDSSPPFTSSGSPGDIGAIASSTATAFSGSHLGSSQAVASFAQRCATASRLALFDSLAQQQESIVAGSGLSAGFESAPSQPQLDIVASLADQLAEFKTFGASLQISTSNISNPATGTRLPPESPAGPIDPLSSSNSTPISLRT